MPFACIAVIAIAIIWLIYLTIIQLVSGPSRDPNSSLPVPPRAVSGNGAWPVLGHTLLFMRLGSDMVSLFPPTWREMRCNPWSRQIGETFSVFVWGQWRIVINGEERVRKVIQESELNDGWPYGSPPVTLLGKSCPALLGEKEAGCLRSLISGPLSQSAVMKQAPQFAELAQKCVDDIIAGHFNKGDKHHNDPKDGEQSHKGGEDALNTSGSQSTDSSEHKMHKIKMDALRSYTFDLIDGPVLNLDRYSKNSSSVRLKNLTRDSADDGERVVRFQDEPIEVDEDNPSPEQFMLWIDRLKDGLCDIKFTWGPNWMQIWRLNWYGRALNARKHLEGIVRAHVEEREKLVPVHHEKGRATRDPFTSPLPLLKMTENYFFRNEQSVMGVQKSKIQDSNRARTRSEPELLPRGDSYDVGSPEQGVIPPRRARERAQSEPDFPVPMGSSRSLDKPKTPISRMKVQSVLDEILREADFENRGITNVATTEISLLLWMMMDAGHAWTFMALNLLSKQEEACQTVQAEVDRLELTYGKERLFTSFVLGKMEKLDNLIYEAIRLSPQFLGALKVLSQTVEVDGCQIPKNSNVIFCNPHEHDTFTLDYSSPRRPEEMGMVYPSVELHGFLPLQGLEIPLMVLQTKVFLIVFLQNHSPFVSRRKTFIRKVQMAINKSISHVRKSSTDGSFGGTLPNAKSADSLVDLELGASIPSTPPRNATASGATTPTKGKDEHDRNEELLFTRVPFPEPRRAIHMRLRGDKDIFGTTSPIKEQ